MSGMDIVNSILRGENEEVDPRKTTHVHKDLDLDIDLGTLLASDYNTFDLKALRSEPEKYIKNLTRDNVQLLFNKIWELPTERIDGEIVAKLPKPEYVLPRARCIPKPKPLTKWQRFAKEKGITKKKKGKSKLQWDEELQKWIPTFGYKKAKTEQQKEWLVEVGDDNKPLEDPFAAKKAAKEEKKAKNELQRLRNIAKAKNVKLPKVGLPTREHFPDANQMAQAITVARASTASAGKFQDRLSKEKDAKGIAKEVPGIKRKAQPLPSNIKEEKKLNANLADNVLKSRKKLLHDDLGPPATKRTKTSTVTKKKGKDRKGKVVKGTKKPKGGKGQRDMRLKVGGRKRR